VTVAIPCFVRPDIILEHLWLELNVGNVSLEQNCHRQSSCFSIWPVYCCCRRSNDSHNYSERSCV